MSAKDRAVRMTEGTPWKLIVSFALPLLLGNLFQQLYNVVDSLVVGNFLGSNALAAVSSSGNIIFLMIGFFNGIFAGAGVVIARYFGAEDSENVQKSVHTTVAFALISGVLITIAGTLLVPKLLVWMGTPEDVLPESILYFRIYFMGVVFSVLYNAAAGIFQAVGDSTHPLMYLIISSVTNVVLDLLFVAVFGMGVDGAALATIISQAVSAVLGFWRLFHVKGMYQMHFRSIRIHLPILRQLLIMGVPSGVQNSIISIANVVVQSSINLFGSDAMAGCGSYSKIEGFGFLPVTAFVLALTTYIGQNLGARQFERAKKGAWFGILCGSLLAEAIGLIIYLLAPNLVGLFNDAPQVVAYGTQMARIITPFYFLMAFSHTVGGTMRGAGRAVVPMLVMMICWCLIRVTYLYTIARPSGNIALVMWCYPITWSLSFVIFLCYYLKGSWVYYLAGKADKETELASQSRK